MSKGKAPKFDAGAAIASQTAANNTATKTNAKAAGVTGPYGSASYTFDADGMPSGQVRNFSGPLSTAATNVQGDVAGASEWLPQQRFDLDQVGSGREYGNAVFDQSMAYAQPYLDRRRAQADEQLYNRGLRPGDEAYAAGIDPVMDAESRFLADAASKATMAGYDQRQREIGNELTERNQGYADVNSGIGLLTGMGGLLPQAQSINQQTPVNAMGAYEQQFKADQAAYQQKQAGLQNALKLGVGLLTAPMTGGTSLMGMGAGGLFNGGGGGGYTAMGSLGPGYEGYTPAGWGR